jgi:hypothetical protein
MWQLHMTNPGKEWGLVGNFESATAAVRQIIRLEDSPNMGIHLEMYVDTSVGNNDDEAFGHPEYSGKKALYVVKRQRQ